jgi:hypothetical protein
MSEEKKVPQQPPKRNWVGAVVFVVFVAVLPIMTVVFSKTGLDKYKNIRSEMRYLKDSTRVDFNALNTYQDVELNNELIRGQLVIAGYWTARCNQKIAGFVQQIKDLQGQLSTDDQGKLLFVVHTDDFSTDSTWTLQSYLNEWKLDTSNWKFVNGGGKTRYQMPDDVSCSTIALLDGRVSRKDSTGNYLQGPLLCDYYDLDEQEEVEKLLRHLAVIMPAKQRKSISWKEEEKLYN